MNRLVDDAASDALTVAAARLVRAAGTFEPDPALKTRIRARLHDRDPARVQLRIRWWAVAVLLASMLAIAGAVVGRALVRHDDAPASTLRLGVDPQGPAPAPAPIQVQAPAPPPPTPAAPVVRASPPHRVPAPRGTKPEPAPAPEAILVLEATRALHTAHDPARALALLDDYLAHYPHGVLAEESLTLAIEAASARGDKSAAAYARTYLARFPSGRFVAAARGALARFGE